MKIERAWSLIYSCVRNASNNEKLTVCVIWVCLSVCLFFRLLICLLISDAYLSDIYLSVCMSAFLYVRAHFLSVSVCLIYCLSCCLHNWLSRLCYWFFVLYSVVEVMKQMDSSGPSLSSNRPRQSSDITYPSPTRTEAPVDSRNIMMGKSVR